MCDVNGPFKLCTCDSNVYRTKPHWVLHRFIQNKEEIFVVGQFKFPDPFETISIRSLKRRLNSVNVFDFEYEPQEGDFLELFFASEIDEDEISSDYELEFSRGKWKLLEPFEIYQYKHSLSHRGEIMGPKSELSIAHEQFRENAMEKQLDEFDIYKSYPFIPKILNTKKGLIDFFNKSIKK